MNTDWIDEHNPNLSRYSLSVKGKGKYQQDYTQCTPLFNYRRESSGLMVERSGLESLPGQCAMFLGKTHYSHHASLYTRV